MKVSILLLLFFFNTDFFFAQSEDAWIYFINKPEAQTYLAQPLLMLSQKSLDRRTHHNILVDITDVPIHQPYVTTIHAIENLDVLAHSKWFNCVYVRGELSAIQQTSSLPFVSNIFYANKSLNNSGGDQPTDFNFHKNKWMNSTTRTYGQAQNQIEIHQGQLLHQAGFRGDNKIIAVLDSGFLGVDSAANFQHMFSENRIIGGYNLVNRDNNPYTNHHHGTMVLSTMAVNLPNEFVGTAPQASYLLYVTEDVSSETPLEEALWVEAAELADAAGADVINTSLGYNTFDNNTHNHAYSDLDGQTTFITKGSNMAFNKGMFCVTSAGNAGNSPWFYITAPSDAINTLTVGAINSNLEQVGFSSNGPTSDNRIKPDVVALGQNSAIINADSNITNASGTSFSSPITAGLVASLWQALPQLKNYELLQLIKENSSIFQNPNNQIGYGVPCFYCAYQNTLNSQNNEKSIFEIYPNPFENELYIKFNNDLNTPFHFQLKNILGQTVFQSETNSYQNRLVFNLNAGLYFYEMTSLNTRFSGKLIKK